MVINCYTFTLEVENIALLNKGVYIRRTMIYE